MVKLDRVSFQSKVIHFTSKKAYRTFEEIKGINVTPRQVDILACILAGRTAKTIASFLDISARTVETHIHNLMLKLECNSRERIRDILEVSSKAALLRKRYILLSMEALFHKKLSEIARVVGKEQRSCTLVYQKELANKNQGLQLLESYLALSNYLKHLNIKVALKPLEKLSTIQNDFKKLNNQKSLDPMWSLYLANEEIIPHFEEAWNENSSNPSNFIILLIEPEANGTHTNETPEEIFTTVASKYYLVIFEIIQKLFLTRNLEKVISGFKSQSDAHLLPNMNHLKPLEDVVISDREELSLSNNKPPIFKKKINFKYFKRLIYGFVGLVLLLLVKWFIAGNSQSSNRDIKSLAICSELLIPNDITFLKRPNLIAQIQEKFKADVSEIKTVVLVGIGGSGKSTLARYYGRLHGGSITWEINSETNETLLNSFKDLAYALALSTEQKNELNLIERIPNDKDKGKHFITFVKRNLKNSPGWLLIYDNVESFGDIQEYYPHEANNWGNGNIIITTQDKNIRNVSTINSNNIIKVGELTSVESLKLFTSILKKDDPNHDWPLLKNVPEGFLPQIPAYPLDISIAAYYIKDTQIPYTQYVEYLKHNNDSFESTQQSILQGVGVYTQTRAGIVKLSFKKIAEQHTDFKNLLMLMCLLDSQHMPKSLLESYKRHAFLEEFLRHLRKYSLITTDPYPGGDAIYLMHRSTQRLGRSYLLSLYSPPQMEQFINDMLSLLRQFYKSSITKGGDVTILLIPNLEAMLENISFLNLSSPCKLQHKRDILLMLGYAHYKGSRNLVTAKKYFMEIDHIHSIKPFLDTQTYAALLSDLGDVCCDLGDLTEAIVYAKKALRLWQTIPNSNHFIADNLKNIAIAYSEQNDFKNAALYFKLAIDKLTNTKGEEELLSNIYGRLGNLYAVTYLNSQKGEIAEQYVQKGLNILGASKKYYQAPPSSQKLSCEVVRNKTRLGEVYNRQARFNEALLNGFNEAQYLIDHSFDKCLHNLTKARILLGKGEAFLRTGKLKEAEAHLTSSLRLAKIIIGEGDSLKIKALRAEAYVKLGKMQEAYEDCLDGLKLEKKRVDNHSRLLYAILFYHAAVIKGHMNEHDKALGYFRQFFAEIKSFCESYLTEKDYNSLIKSGAFEVSKHIEQSAYDKLHTAHINSRIIFEKIYGNNHPFLKDYVIKNSQEFFQFG